jgi:hypothetical protein
MPGDRTDAVRDMLEDERDIVIPLGIAEVDDEWVGWRRCRW